MQDQLDLNSTFLVDRQGWEEAGDAPSVMTRVLIAADGRSVLQIDQNDVINPSTSD